MAVKGVFLEHLAVPHAVALIDCQPFFEQRVSESLQEEYVEEEIEGERAKVEEVCHQSPQLRSSAISTRAEEEEEGGVRRRTCPFWKAAL